MREINTKEFQTNAVRDNVKIIQRSDNWLSLAYLESLAIKNQKATLNMASNLPKIYLYSEMMSDILLKTLHTVEVVTL